jgi:hypothetical protein
MAVFAWRFLVVVSLIAERIILTGFLRDILVSSMTIGMHYPIIPVDECKQVRDGLEDLLQKCIRTLKSRPGKFILDCGSFQLLVPFP